MWSLTELKQNKFYVILQVYNFSQKKHFVYSRRHLTSLGCQGDSLKSPPFPHSTFTLPEKRLPLDTHTHTHFKQTKYLWIFHSNPSLKIGFPPSSTNFKSPWQQYPTRSWYKYMYFKNKKKYFRQVYILERYIVMITLVYVNGKKMTKQNKNIFFAVYEVPHQKYIL